jgi:hypothetical protein
MKRELCVLPHGHADIQPVRSIKAKTSTRSDEATMQIWT